MAADRRLRLAGLVWGAVFLLWLPVEDVTPSAALALAGGAAVWGVARWGRGLAPGRWWLAGLAAGLALAPLAAGLLVFKSGLHSHGFPDFGPRQLLGALAGTPAWGLGGALAGGVAAALTKQRNR